MAINKDNNVSNTGNNFKKADAWLRITFEDAEGNVRKVNNSDVALYEDNILGRSLINAAKADADFTLGMTATVHVVNATPLEEQEDVKFG